MNHLPKVVLAGRVVKAFRASSRTSRKGRGK